MTARCDSASREYRDPEWLPEKYVDEGLLTYDLAERCGVTDTTIRDWLDRHGIDTRPTNGRETRRECAIYRMHHEGYMIWQSSHRLTSGRDRRQTRVRVHTLLGIAEGASPESSSGKGSTHVVHHKNGIRWVDILLRLKAEESRAVGVSGVQSNQRTTTPFGHG